MARVSRRNGLTPTLGNAMVDGEDRILLEDSERDRGVEKAHMVERDDRMWPGLGDVLETMNLEPVENP